MRGLAKGVPGDLGFLPTPDIRGNRGESGLPTGKRVQGPRVNPILENVMAKYQEPKFIQTRQTYTVPIEGNRLFRSVVCHTLYHDGTAEERVMPLYEALQHQADMITETKAITIYAF